MNQKLKNLLMGERAMMRTHMLGIGDEPNEDIAKAALTRKRPSVNWDRYPTDCHAPSRVARHAAFPFLPTHLSGITAHERA